MLDDENLAAALGAAGRERALSEFQQETVWDAIVQEYLQLLEPKDCAFRVPPPGTCHGCRCQWPGCFPMRSFAKRLTDVFLSAIALLILAPLMAAIALTIRLSPRAPRAIPADAPRLQRQAVHAAQIPDHDCRTGLTEAFSYQTRKG